MRLTRPTRATGRERPRDYNGVYHRNITAAPIRSCSRWGLPCRPCCQGRGALLPHRFALARGARLAHANPPCTGGLFSVALSLRSPSPAVSRHRIPVEPGLSSISGIAPPTAAVRLSGQRHVRPRQPTVKRSDRIAPHHVPRPGRRSGRRNRTCLRTGTPTRIPTLIPTRIPTGNADQGRPAGDWDPTRRPPLPAP
jgi:hypothetical protein